MEKHVFSKSRWLMIFNGIMVYENKVSQKGLWSMTVYIYMNVYEWYSGIMVDEWYSGIMMNFSHSKQ